MRLTYNTEQFLQTALNTEGGLAIPFTTRAAAVNFRRACASAKARNKAKMAQAFAHDPDYQPFSMYDGLLFHINQVGNLFYLHAERQADVAGEAISGVELAKLRAKVEKPSVRMGKPSAVDKA